jgi:predicted kinase
VTDSPDDSGSSSDSGFPSPSLVVLVGASRSGKSTWAAARFDSNEIVSLSELNSIVGKDTYDSMAGPDAYDLLGRIVAMRTRRGLTVVIDTDGLEKRWRLRWLDAAAGGSIPTYAVIFASDLSTCVARNALSTRPRPEAVIKRQVMRTFEIGPEIESEGFEVFVVR